MSLLKVGYRLRYSAFDYYRDIFFEVMKLVIQRVTKASVGVDGETISSINAGLLVLVGVTRGDTEFDASHLAKKTAGLRIFEDEQGKMNLSVGQVGGSILSISQFTLYGDASKGNRPSFMAAAAPVDAEPLYDRYVAELAAMGFEPHVGRFGADMKVELLNDGPVTLLLESCGRLKG